jgi:hypothetical protein
MERTFRMSKGLFIAIAACTILCGCNPRMFTMQRMSGWPIEGHLACPVGAVEVTSDNSLDLHDGAYVALTSHSITDGRFSTEVRMPEGSTLTFYLRTNRHTFLHRADSGAVIRIGSRLTRVSMPDGRVYDVPAIIPHNQPVVIEFAQDGDYLDVTVNCTRLERVPWARPSTKTIIVAARTQGTVALVDPLFEPLYTEE